MNANTLATLQMAFSTLTASSRFSWASLRPRCPFSTADKVLPA